ncbi:SPFH domain-containing protein [Terracoccus sp. 273MFTsu3.1]|uniref:SPFH domain-containing protein n=1 Tax=Terracoccus sp. 273MFTsu3.1 TaxID=1172188 RepID=UPI0005BD7BEB|nr:SPFH domain-containing protein [Terracoccus sp. 273MFTsu3.1]
MSTAATVILIVLLLPILGIVAFIVISASLIKVPAGALGLVLKNGKATEHSLTPGRHWVPLLRKTLVVEYPSVEMAYRAGEDASSAASQLDSTGPSLSCALGDRALADVAYTVRYAIIPERLRTVHERFGPEGIHGLVRDASGRAVSRALSDPAVTVETLFGRARSDTEARLAEAVTAALEEHGLRVTGFVLGPVDLGRTGEVIQATVRATFELALEEAEAATRIAQAQNDGRLEQEITTVREEAWRYRETDLWRDLVQRSDGVQVGRRRPGYGPGRLGLTVREDTPAGEPAPASEQPPASTEPR